MKITKEKIKKACLICGTIFSVSSYRIKIGKGKFCSRKCKHLSQKGFIPWNKGKKGVYSEEVLEKMRQSSKGQIGWNKGLKGKGICKTPPKCFKKGNVPWNKGKTGIYSKEILKKISEAQKGSKNLRWKGGRRKTQNGYILVFQPDHPFCNCQNYVYEHRLVMEKMLGRYLTPEETLHHVNEIKDDNRPENLRLFENKSEHAKFHHPKGKKITKKKQCSLVD